MKPALKPALKPRILTFGQFCKGDKVSILNGFTVKLCSRSNSTACW